MWGDSSVLSPRCILNMKHFQNSQYSQEVTSLTEKTNQEEEPESNDNYDGPLWVKQTLGNQRFAEKWTFIGI